MSESYLVAVRGVVNIFGAHDVGKTVAAIGASDPRKTVFVDGDLKGLATVRQLQEAGIEFLKYLDLSPAFAGGKPTADFYAYARRTVTNEIPDNAESIVWDNWNPVYEAARMYVDRNRAAFKNVVNWSGTSSIIMGLVSKVARKLEEEVLIELSKKAKIVIVTHHLKDRYEHNVKVGKIPEASRLFDRVCTMRLWLRHNYASPVPIMLFPKRPNKPVYNPELGRLDFVNFLPRKIVPIEQDHSVWDAVERYWNDPIANREPRLDEMPDEYEIAMMEGVLSEDQKHMLEIARDLAQMVASLDAEESEETEAQASETVEQAVAPAERVLALRATGLELPDIMRQLAAEDIPLSPPQVMEIINNGG